MDEELKYAVENGIIDLSYIRETFEMNKREEILKKHPYSIWQGKNEYWFTYLPKTDGGRKLVKKKTEDDIKKTVVDYWKNIDKNKFKTRYKIWVERQEACGRSDNTIYKYEKDYERFFKGDPLEEMKIQSITEEHISLFIQRLLKRKEVPWRALKAMFGYMNGVFEKAIVDGVVEKNPCRHVDLPIFRKHCVEARRKTDAERTVSPVEKEMLIEKLKKNERIEKYAVEFSFCVGMRVGEIAALRWEDIDFERKMIFLHHSEKYNQRTKERTISETKTGKNRIVPITKEAEGILYRIIDYEKRNETFGEFVFMNEKGRVIAKRISNCIYKNTKSGDFSSTKSIHAIRRTLNSNMRKNGVSAAVAASILGHSEKVNEMNYTYDVATLDEKMEILKNAAARI